MSSSSSWDRVQSSDDACGIAEDNLRDAERAMAKEPKSPPIVAAAWDRKTAPKYLDLVSARFALEAKEKAMLEKNGFVVPARLGAEGPACALHEIYQSELPLYVSIDAVMHAIFSSNDRTIKDLERDDLMPTLDRVLLSMHCALPSASKEYSSDTARDLDLYLTVGRSLLAGAPQPSAFGVDAEAKALVDKAIAANEFDRQHGVPLFGRARTIDFTAYQPRGHYTDDEDLTRYFRAAMWLSRLELNLVSRSCRSSQPDPSADGSETPREAVDALALEDLAERAHALDDVALLDRAWRVLAGKREDVSLADLRALREKSGITSLMGPDVAPALRAAIGDGFQRTTRIHYMPNGTSTLPAIFTLLGPRIVADSTALEPLTEPHVGGRTEVHVEEVAYALGHDRGKKYLASELAQYPTLSAGLEESRKVLRGPLEGDLYATWLAAIRGLSESPKGALPSFASSEAFADLRLDSAIAGFGQLRHNYVLIAAQEYFQGGCAIPDAWVEPAPSTYDALVKYADRLEGLEAELHPDAKTRDPYPARLGAVLRVLRSIQNDELEGRPLTASQKRWLSMVVEPTPSTTGHSATYTGWYFDLFRDRREALGSPSFVADYFTGTRVAYAGVSGTRFGLFVVDAGGPPRVMVGPVARAYETSTLLGEKRLDDSASIALAESEKHDPWAKSYTLAAPKEPSMIVGLSYDDYQGDHYVITVKTTQALGAMTLELLDHHRRHLRAVTRTVGKGLTKFDFIVTNEMVVEGVHVHAGAFHDWIFWGYDGGPFKSYGGAKEPEATSP